MNYYEEFQTAKKYKLNALDLYCSYSAEWFLKDYCGIKEQDSSYIEKFNNVTATIRSTYLNFDNISFSDIEGYLMELKDDEHNLSIDSICDYITDYISNKWDPSDIDKNIEMEM